MGVAGPSYPPAAPPLVDVHRRAESFLSLLRDASATTGARWPRYPASRLCRQESGILAEQSGDLAYLAAYATGDIHMAAAKLCKIVPESATDITHPKERGQLKTVNHGLAYGARPKLAAQLGIDLATAEHLYSTHRRVFHRVHDYLAASVDTADNYRRSTCQDGWSKRIVPPFSATTALNYGVQATGAAILRRAIVLVDRAGLPLVATVHDSLIFVCRLQDAVMVPLEAERLMVDAAAYFCPGITLRVDFSASVPVPGMPSDRQLKPLANPAIARELRPGVEASSCGITPATKRATPCS